MVLKVVLDRVESRNMGSKGWILLNSLNGSCHLLIPLSDCMNLLLSHFIVCFFCPDLLLVGLSQVVQLVELIFVDLYLFEVLVLLLLLHLNVSQLVVLDSLKHL